MTGPPRTVDEVAAPYVNFLVRVPPGGPGVCTVCHSTVSADFTRCYQCGPAVQVLGNATADLTAFVSMAPRTEQLARELITYKNPNVRAEDRQWKTVGLAAVLWKWLGVHEACLINRLGIDGFDLITSVPSTSGRPSHPLRTVVAGVVSGSEKRYADVLYLARGDLDQHVQAADASAPLWLSAAHACWSSTTPGPRAPTRNLPAPPSRLPGPGPSLSWQSGDGSIRVTAQATLTRNPGWPSTGGQAGTGCVAASILAEHLLRPRNQRASSRCITGTRTRA